MDMVYTWEALKERYSSGERVKYVFFWKPTPSSDGRITETCLSQWWMCNFTVQGIQYSCAEQYMMAEKARLFHDNKMWNRIMSANQPKEMKAYGRAVQNFNQAVWEASCYALVKEGNLAKFSQNLDLWEYLKTTQKRILVEASPRDRIWGIGMERNNPDAINPLKWRGKNLLGFVLTEVRDILLEKEKESRGR